jgi:predicted metal-dependent hydrolase
MKLANVHSNGSDKSLESWIWGRGVFDPRCEGRTQIQGLAVRPMRTKWASCSTAGRLQFSTDLLDLDREVGDYVIVHELLHFSVPNHGKLWKSLMRAHLGNYEKWEGKLRRVAAIRH